METETSVHYFRGKEARGLGQGRDACSRHRGLARVAWQKGWDDEDALRGRQARTPEQAAEHAEAVAWLDSELEEWGKSFA